MKKVHAFRILLVLVMVFLPLVAVTPAYAGGLTHHQMVIPIYEDIPSPGTENPCGFDVLFHQEGNLRINYWTDKNGSWIREFDSWGNIKRIATANDKTVNLLVQGSVKYEYTYISETEAMVKVIGNGIAVLIVAPGEGRILGGAGLQEETYIFDTTDPGNWVVIDYSLDRQAGNFNFDWTPFCEYMAP